ncbi:MAG: D-TA family PLP-dependent enzyme [Planctomycetota bacterium]|nr:MAG: D-TA family PLP-dependent enzyme [Planctomycetota bacterium]REK31037.1 MAG: D-TA family PLP-dependent enzyme [Planctomycetota bacterium]REK36847.1 MAG: D-TA family PLP-dependent enzyme [Planctomycetota bacterium]
MDAVYRIDDPSQIISPGLVVFRDLVAANIDAMIEMAGDAGRLRPHCKTHKMHEVTRMQLKRGIKKHKAATFAEAEMLAEAGVKDVFLAYNLVGPNIQRAVRYRQAFPDVTFSVTADDVPSLKQLSEAMQSAGGEIEVLLDVDPGRHRTGLEVGDAARDLYRMIADLPGVVPGGFHIYDGHLGISDVEERRAGVLQEWERTLSFRDRLVSEGLPVPRLVCGGTPTFPVYAGLTEPTMELSPGTCVFHDCGYGEKFPDLSPFRPAALVLTRVISRPTANRVTFDVGTKGVASDPPMGSRVLLPDIPDAEQVLQNEEHLVVETAQAARWSPGDVTLAIPRHICPTSALHKHAWVVADGAVIGTWDVASRDRWLTI